jgi:hypothetical protein
MGPVADRSSVELDELAWKFLGSEFSQDIYADWPLDRDSTPIFGTHHQLGRIVNDGAVYSGLLDRVMTNIGAAHRGGILSHGADARRRRLEPEMTQTEPGEDVIRNAVMLACRAPSLHNTQPWRWTFDGAGLHLFADRLRVVLSTDSTGREVLLSCGAVLDHLRVAMAAAGWDTTVERFPDPHHPDHVAALRFTPISIVTDAQCERAGAQMSLRSACAAGERKYRLTGEATVRCSSGGGTRRSRTAWIHRCLTPYPALHFRKSLIITVRSQSIWRDSQ